MQQCRTMHHGGHLVLRGVTPVGDHPVLVPGYDPIIPKSHHPQCSTCEGSFLIRGLGVLLCKVPITAASRRSDLVPCGALSSRLDITSAPGFGNRDHPGVTSREPQSRLRAPPQGHSVRPPDSDMRAWPSPMFEQGTVHSM